MQLLIAQFSPASRYFLPVWAEWKGPVLAGSSNGTLAAATNDRRSCLNPLTNKETNETKPTDRLPDEISMRYHCANLLVCTQCFILQFPCN